MSSSTIENNLEPVASEPDIEIDDYDISPMHTHSEQLITEYSNDEHPSKPPQWPLNYAPNVHLSYGVKLYLFAMVFGSCMTATSKYAMQDCNHYVVSMTRMIFTFLPSIGWLYYKNVEGMFWGTPGLRKLLFLRGLVGTLNLLCVYYAVQYLPLPDYSVINFLMPLATAAGAYFVLGESYHWTQAVASLVSLIGVVIITRPGFLFSHGRSLPPDVTEWQYDTAIAAVLLQVLGAVCIFLLLRKIAGRLTPQTIMANYALQTIILSIVGLIYDYAAGSEPVKWPSKSSTWVALIIVSIIGFIYQYLLTLAVTAEKAGVLTQFDYLQILFSMSWQVALFHSLPDYISVLGGALILLGVWAANKSKPAV